MVFGSTVKPLFARQNPMPSMPCIETNKHSNHVLISITHSSAIIPEQLAGAGASGAAGRRWRKMSAINGLHQILAVMLSDQNIAKMYRCLRCCYQPLNSKTGFFSLIGAPVLMAGFAAAADAGAGDDEECSSSDLPQSRHLKPQQAKILVHHRGMLSNLFCFHWWGRKREHAPPAEVTAGGEVTTGSFLGAGASGAAAAAFSNTDRALAEPALTCVETNFK